MPHLPSQTTILLLLCFSVLAQKAPEFVFPNFEFPDGTHLKDHSDKGVILVYGDSSCPACKKAQGHLKIRHERWKEWGFPIVYIALDSDPQDLKQNFGIPPWPLYCDGKSWDSPWVTAADIHAVPTLYVLNHNLKLRFKAENVGQMDLWLLKNKSDSN